MDYNERLEKLTELVNDFRECKSNTYNETQTRVDFIDKLFYYIGWDVYNENKWSARKREVVLETKVMVGNHLKTPDYGFQFGGEPKFYVEAKRPSINIKDSREAAFQVRSYASSAKLKISILTNFKEFAVYDARVAPDEKDKPSVARIFYCTFEQYSEKFDFLVKTFSHNAMGNEKFDDYVNSNKNKRGTTTIDEKFLKDIEEWREKLAVDIAPKNKSLNIYDLNHSVQKIIDRLIFLRFAEDRGIDDYGALEKLIKQKYIYSKLDVIFKKANEKYNSGLFEQKEWLSNLVIKDEVLSYIIAGLYYPAPYVFSVFPIEILGNVYEQFLGKTIRLTKSNRAKVEEKPEVKKNNGVFYTPQYIVDYIVENTVGVKIKNKKPVDIAKLSILDPACGSGSFLVRVYTFLLKYHLEYYTSSEKIQKTALRNEQIYEVDNITFRLSIEEKQRILLSNIYGVDIDRQAVEVTKLSLLLKLMEGETAESTNNLFKHSEIKPLPDLSDNIKCGNSLIANDFYESKDMSLFGYDEQRTVNAFDWDDEEKGFKKIMDSGGFDVVVGNPPYVYSRSKGIEKGEKEYYYKNYKYQQSQLNTYSIFVEKGYRLLKIDGRMGFITPNNWLSLSSFKIFRDFIISSCNNLKIINNLFKVFKGASVDTLIIVFSKQKPSMVELIESDMPNEYQSIIKIPFKELLKEKIIKISLYRNIKQKNIISKIENIAVLLSDISKVSTGLKAYQTGKGKPPQKDSVKKDRIFHSREKIDGMYKKYLAGKDVKRYLLEWSGEFLKYGDWLAEPRASVPFLDKRILVRQIPSRPPYSINAVFIEDEFLNDINSMVIFNFIKFSPKYILGIINSKLLTFWFDKRFDKFQRKIFPQFKVNELALFPIRTIDFDNPDDVKQHDRMVSLVDQMLTAQADLQTATSDNDKKIKQQRVDILDKQIDSLVYELYGLTEEEVVIVKG